TGIWPLMEYENGALKLSGPSVVLLNKEKRKPIEEYLKLQGRFKALSDSDIKEIKAEVDKMWEIIEARIKAKF
ncbi:MAG: hypothetical protein QXX74_02540, partial [Candidatus Micrarchaeaceae archaeon]